MTARRIGIVGMGLAALVSLAVTAIEAPLASAGAAAAKPGGPGGGPGKPGKPTCGGERPAKAEGGSYTCTFEDDFNAGGLDLGKWMVQDTSRTGVITGTNGCYVDDPDNVAVADGLLRLTARVEEPFLCRSPYGDFTTDTSVATVTSYGLFNQTYGRFEFRAKFPDTTEAGAHSALWLYPQQHTYGKWPYSGEIDVAEWFSGDPGKVYPSVHYAGENPWLSTGWTCEMATAGTQFHRYAVEWTPTVMRFYYDGRLCHSHSWTPEAPLVAPQPFDRPFYLVMTQVFGHGWNARTAQTPGSATTLVDWVRAWK